jgi:hypothetical protein
MSGLFQGCHRVYIRFQIHDGSAEGHVLLITTERLGRQVRSSANTTEYHHQFSATIAVQVNQFDLLNVTGWTHPNHSIHKAVKRKSGVGPGIKPHAITAQRTQLKIAFGDYGKLSGW